VCTGLCRLRVSHSQSACGPRGDVSPANGETNPEPHSALGLSLFRRHALAADAWGRGQGPQSQRRTPEIAAAPWQTLRGVLLLNFHEIHTGSAECRCNCFPHTVWSASQHRRGAQANPPWAIRLSVCQCSAVSGGCRPPGPVSAVSQRDAEPVPGTVAAKYGPGLSLSRRRRVGQTSRARAQDESAGNRGRLQPASLVRHALYDGAHRGGRTSPLRAPVGGPFASLADVCGRDALCW
jgi:hypothetical protein